MAFDDMIGDGGPDFSAESVLDKISGRTLPDLPDNATGDMVLNRLNRKLSTGRREPDFGTGKADAKAPDFADQGTPLDKLPDFSQEGTPLAEAVPLPRARPPGAPSISLGTTGHAKALLKGIPVGAAEGTGGVLKGAAAIYDNGVPAAPAMPQYDATGAPLGTQSEPTAAIPAKPLQERSLYKAGQSVSDLAPTMSPQERDSIAGRVGIGIGGIAPYAAATLAGGPVIGIAAGFTGMAADTYGKVYEDAKSHGASDDVAHSAAGRSALVAGVLGSLPLGAGKYAQSLIGKVASSGAAFATAGEAQEAILQEIAKDYDPKAGYTFDQKRLIAELILGAGMGGLHHAFEDRSQPPQQPQPGATPQQPGAGLPPPGPQPAPGAQPGAGPGPHPGAGPRPGTGTPPPGGGAGPQPNTGGPGQQQQAPPGTGPTPGSGPGKPPPGSGTGKAGEAGYTMDPAARAKMERVYRHFEPGKDPSKMSDGELFDAVNEHLRDTSSTGHTAKPETPEEAKVREDTARGRDETTELKAAFAWMTDAQIQSMTPQMREVWLGRARGKPQGTSKEAPSKQQADDEAARKAGFRNADEVGPDSYEPVRGEHNAEFNDQDLARGEKPILETSESDVGAVTREDPIKAETTADVRNAQPAEPTEAQAQAENYKHAHIELDHLGLTGKNSISVETGVGGTRKGIAPDGTPWEVKLDHAAYGRIKGTTGADGQPLDIFVGPHPQSPHVFIIDQHHPDADFDEHKIMAGYRTPIDALHAYANSYEDGAKGRIGHVTAMGPEEFKAWLAGDTTKALKPASGEPVKAPEAGQSVATTEVPVPSPSSPKETPTGGGSAGRSEPIIPEAEKRSVRESTQEQHKSVSEATNEAVDGEGGSRAQPKLEGTQSGQGQEDRQDISDVAAISAEADQAEVTSAHHEAIEQALGPDADKVAQVDIARAAEIMAERPEIDLAAAFGRAVIENAVREKFITDLQARKAYGPEVEDVLESLGKGPSGRGRPVEQGGAKPDKVDTVGAKETGVVPSGGKAGVESEPAKPAKAARDDTAATAKTAEQPAAGRDKAAGDDTGDTAENRPAAKNADDTGVVAPAKKPTLKAGESDGISPPVHGRDAGPEPEALPSSEGQRGVGPTREPESAGGEPDVPADNGEPAGQPASEAGGGGGSEGDAVRVSGRHADTEAGPAERAVQRDADAVKGENYRIEPGALGEDRGPKAKAADNINAIKLANHLVAEGRPATAAEQHQLARYVGWGGIKNAFPDADGNIAKGFEKIASDLKAVLTPEEYETARRSIQYAHYTAEDVINGMWQIAERLGFKGGHVFEPGMGVGHFAGLMPADVAAHTIYNGVEMDHVTARIAALLYPKWGVRREDFTKMPLAENAFDLVIGNPPFADIAIKSDPKYAKNGFLLHDYFFAKSLDAVRPGGVLAFVTSAGTMNKIDTAARDYFAERAEFVGAIRLPSNAFKKNAGTEVTTDIVILRKRMPGEKAGSTFWVGTSPVSLPGPDGKPTEGRINSYFAEHPEMVLGQGDFADKLYEGRYSVKAPKDFDLKAELAKAIDKLPRNVMGEAETPQHKAETDFSGSEKKDGSYYLKDGKLMQQRAGAGYEVERRGKGVEGGKSAAEIERIQGLIPIRDALRETFKADLADDADAGKRARAKLNKAYDAFTAKFGPINKAEIQRRRPNAIQSEAARAEAREEARYAGQPFDEGSFDPSRMIAAGKSLTEIARARKAAIADQGGKYTEGDFNPEEMPDVIIDKRPNIEPFIDDQESYRLRAIEHYDEPTGKAKKSDVFTKNVISKDRAPEIKSVHDAVLHVLNQKGALDLDSVAALVDKSRSEAIEALGERIYQVPGTSDAWETGEKYLSGNVRKKLAVAKAAAEKNPAFRRNVAALEAAQPAPLAPSQIGASLGMPWIPPDVIEKFATEGLGLERLKASYVPALASWHVAGDSSSLAASTTWGTSRRDAVKLLTDALNRQSPKIYDEHSDGTRTLNVTATQAASEKMQAIRDKFNEWIFSDEKRADRLANFYNENYNNLVVQEFNGDYLTTPGISQSWSWRPHQTRVIARIIQSGNTYMAHAVGAGKTSAMIGAGMEMRRLGLVKKPAYAVPNHMLAQFTKEFYEQYPTARIMVADERAFHTDRRKQFMANVALSDLDAVIMTHSSFGMIPVSDEFQDQVIEEQLDEYRHALADMPKGGDNRITRSRIEKQIERLEQRLSGKSNRKRDAVFNFDEMGIDFLFVDEAHLFRKLDFTTQMSNLKGITPQGSGASWDLYVKSKLLDKRNPGRSLVLASGTPVTNTMAELFTVSRYLQPNELQERQLHQFDAWAGAFGENVTELEQDAAGGYKPVSRFAKFVNVAELSAMVRQVMDVVTSRQLEQYVVRPKLKGGKRRMNLAEKSPALDRYQASLAARMKAMEGRGKPKPGDDIMLKVIGDGRHAAIDMRLVGADKGDAKHPSKLDLLIDNVARLHKETKTQKLYRAKNGAYDLSKPADVGPATQMIFANLGISGTRGFAVPDYIRSELVRRGVPRSEIALIADYKSHVAKQRLFNDMNEGKVRVLIGSTSKMATGVNAQRRLYAVHNLDPLWYPSDDEQRNGRALRQGNMNPEIEIHDYSTKGTYDSTMWGMMEKKARFIQGFFEGDPSLRSMDDLGEASQYEQAKALTTNDPRLMRLTEIKQELEKANRRKSAFDNERYAVRRRRADAKNELEHYGAREIGIEKDIAQRVPLVGDAFTAKIGRESYDKRVEFGDALLQKMDAIGTKENNGRHMPIGEISGFSLVATPQFIIDHVAVHLDLKRNGGAESHITVGTSGLGAVRSMEAIISGFDSDLAHVRDRIKSAEKFLKESESDHEKKFTGDADMAKLASEIAGLQAELSAKKEEPQAGLVGQAQVLEKGRQSGNEHMIAYDVNGKPVFESEGTSRFVKFSPEFVDELKNPANDIVAHHNHPSGMSLSHTDLMTLAYPGLRAVWAHGHNGSVYRSELTPEFDAAFPVPEPKSKKIEAIYTHIRWRLQPIIQQAFDLRLVGEGEANDGVNHLIVDIMAQAGVVDYQTNFDLGGFVSKVKGLDDTIKNAIVAARKEAFGDNATGNGPDRRAGTLRHAGDLGTSFDRTALVAGISDEGRGNSIGKDSDFGEAPEGEGLASPNNTFTKPGSTDTSLADILGRRLLGRLSDLNLTEARVHLQDKFARVKNAEESVGAPTTQSAYQAESLYYGRTGQRLEQLTEHHIDPIIREMKGRDIKLDKMDEFLYARHAPERNNKIGAMHPPGHDFHEAIRDHDKIGGSGWSTNEALGVIRAARAAGKLQDYLAVAKMIDTLNFRTRQTLFNAGLIDRDTLDAWNNGYKYYVPLRGHAEGDQWMAGGSGMNIRGKEAKTAFGRRSKAESPVAYSIMQAEAAIVRAEKNKVGNTFLQFVRANPDPARWTVDRPPLVKRIDPTTGLVTTVPDNLYANRDNVFTTKVNGRDVHVTLHGPDGLNLARALKNMGTANVHRLLRVYSTVTHTMAKLATSWNPEFMIPNLARDMGEAFINLSAQQQRGFVRNFVKHIPGAIRGSMQALAGGGGNHPPGSPPRRYIDAFHEFDKEGGRIRFFGIEEPDQIETNVERKLKRLDGGALNTIKDFGDKASKMLEIAGGGIENATRLAAFMAARDAGFSAPDAAMMARNLTVDFNKKGELGGAISSLYMFANAGIQGQARMARSLGHRRVWMAVGGLAAAAALSTLFSIYAGGEDEAGVPNYMKVPPWERDKNLIFMTPSGYYAKVPLPYGFAPFAVIGSRAITTLMGHEKPGKAAGAVISSIWQAFNPLGEESTAWMDIVPSAIRPAFHIQFNKNWTDKPLYPEQDRARGNRPDSTQAFRNDSAFSKETAKQLNAWSGGNQYKSGTFDVHPGSIDHALQAIGGGVGRFAKGVVDSLYNNAITGGEWQPEKTPILRRFVGKVGEEADRAAFYEKRQEVKDLERNIVAAKKDRKAGVNVDEANEALSEAAKANPQKAIFERADKQMRKLRKQEDEITNGARPFEEKRDALAAVRANMRKVQNDARAASTRLKEGGTSPVPPPTAPGRLEIDTTQWGRR